MSIEVMVIIFSSGVVTSLVGVAFGAWIAYRLMGRKSPVPGIRKSGKAMATDDGQPKNHYEGYGL